MNIPAVFEDHLNKFIIPDDTLLDNIMSYFSTEQVKKKQLLLSEGQICRHHFFVLDGCLRKFFINDKGVEQTTEFAIEHWWLTDGFAFEHQQPAQFYIQAVESSELLVINHSNQEKLLQNFPVMERYFRYVYQRAYSAAQMKFKYMHSFSKEDYYHFFANAYPEFVQRIPQYLLASFLGFTPEYLSEIRAKKSS